MKSPDLLRRQLRPAAGTAAEVEPFGARRQAFEREDRKVSLEQPAMLLVAHRILIEGRPLLAEAFDGLRIDIARRTHGHEAVLKASTLVRERLRYEPSAAETRAKVRLCTLR